MIRGAAMMQVVAEAFYVAGAATLAAVGSSVAHRLREGEFRARRQLEIANEKAETLLHNTLPAAIADRLKHDPSAIARRHSSATVLFADIANFTELSGGLEPEELIRFLNDLFSALDRLTERFRLEKIKTIGDAYMVAGGLPEPRPDHAEAVARMALEMQRVVKQLPTPGGNEIRIRIGIHTGPVVAGVIGTKRLAYDLWGDTVNIASRMESHGEADTIQVSEATYQLLRERFDLHPRGSIEIKGKGPMNAYLLLRER
jgi:class 3 adenylate cyclase